MFSMQLQKTVDVTVHRSCAAVGYRKPAGVITSCQQTLAGNVKRSPVVENTLTTCVDWLGKREVIRNHQVMKSSRNEFIHIHVNIDE